MCVLHLLVAVGVGDGRIHQSPPSTEHSEEEHKRKEMEICLFFLGGGVSFQFDKGKKMKRRNQMASKGNAAADGLN